jgi:NAD(P)-dependent dehydrogenase (short-subunit alcohol dehydrogenase family)
MTTLQNKTPLVTGASRGIGRATAAALAEAGAHVLVHYGRSKQEAESLVAEIKAKGGRGDAIAADPGGPGGASLLARQVRSIVGDRLDVRYKGDCTYYSSPIGEAKSEYAVWTYEKPYQSVASIA